MRWFALCLSLCLLSGCESGTHDERAAAGSLRLGAVLQESAQSQNFARAERVRPFVFPADHGAHPTFRSEWWYLTANLQSEAGPEYGLQFTVFRQALSRQDQRPANAWQEAQVYLGHFAVSDVDKQSHVEAERLSRSHPELAGLAMGADGWPTVALLGWQLEFGPEGLALVAEDREIGARLALRAERLIVPQGDNGLSRKSPGNASYYYSFPRLAVEGELRVGGEWLPVSGLAWFDHEWSTSVLSDEQAGWDWFALHLADGRDLMAFRLRRRDGLRDPFDHGVIVGADGTAMALTHDRFELEPTRWWTDPDGTRWPLAWRLVLPSEVFEIEARFDDQRMQTLISYWEGTVVVHDDHGARQGTGYMELTGYGG